jgi:hypothetical protein
MGDRSCARLRLKRATEVDLFLPSLREPASERVLSFSQPPRLWASDEILTSVSSMTIHTGIHPSICLEGEQGSGSEGL